MKKRIIALFLLAALSLTLLAACGEKEEPAITKEKAIEIALKDAGIVDASKYHIHADPSPNADNPTSYIVHIHGNNEEHSYVVDAKTGSFVKN